MAPIDRLIVARRVLDYSSAALREPLAPVRHRREQENRMPVSQELLEILVCPETKQRVSLAAEEIINQVNARIEAGALRNRGGQAVSARVSEGLLREDGQILYIVDDGIPVMLVEEAIELS